MWCLFINDSLVLNTADVSLHVLVAFLFAVTAGCSAQ